MLAHHIAFLFFLYFAHRHRHTDSEKFRSLSASGSHSLGMEMLNENTEPSIQLWSCVRMSVYACMVRGTLAI